MRFEKFRQNCYWIFSLSLSISSAVIPRYGRNRRHASQETSRRRWSRIAARRDGFQERLAQPCTGRPWPDQIRPRRKRREKCEGYEKHAVDALHGVSLSGCEGCLGVPTVGATLFVIVAPAMPPDFIGAVILSIAFMALKFYRRYPRSRRRNPAGRTGMDFFSCNT